ncbi:Uncharacterized protein dnm_018960 [Desulfonema magnum]|uniref:Uncharacterized protein n=1 Tax=Desulfonema magnum TaxID=45655 RepID=A0A975BID5_9BACT|nr:Uncharacterized protein dnm_018960 [Desulfonema magnum]
MPDAVCPAKAFFSKKLRSHKNDDMCQMSDEIHGNILLS